MGHSMCVVYKSCTLVISEVLLTIGCSDGLAIVQMDLELRNPASFPTDK